MNSIEIGSRRIGAGQPCFVIAEAGVNHNGDEQMARRLLDAAADAGADAVKFQTFSAKRMISPVAPKAAYQRGTSDAGESQLDMVRKLELPREAFARLSEHARQRGIIFLSTPFDRQSVDLLVELGVPAMKISSGEVTNWPFLEYVAKQGLPVILSTGMSYLSEVDEAVRVLRSARGATMVGGAHPTEWIALLHCVSSYPTEPADANLRAMATMATAMQVPVGYSDHTLGIEVSLAAVAVGACVIEKHFTLDRSLPGPDHKASLDPTELRALVRGIRNVESALGHGRKEPVPAEADVAAVARRSLAAAGDLPAGAVLTAEMLTELRPGTGLPPSMIRHVLGRRLKSALAAGSLLEMGMLV